MAMIVVVQRTRERSSPSVLDAAPLLVQARITGLADKYYIPPSVVAELRDARARDYLHTLHTTGQIDLEVREPGAQAMKKST